MALSFGSVDQTVKTFSAASSVWQGYLWLRPVISVIMGNNLLMSAITFFEISANPTASSQDSHVSLLNTLSRRSGKQTSIINTITRIDWLITSISRP